MSVRQTAIRDFFKPANVGQGSNCNDEGSSSSLVEGLLSDILEKVFIKTKDKGRPDRSAKVVLDRINKRTLQDYNIEMADVSRSKRPRTDDDFESANGTDAETEAEYEVEAILDYSFCKERNVGLYLIKWIGWEREEDRTWEPRANLECLEKLKEFYLKRVEDRERARPGQKRFIEVPPDPRDPTERRSDILEQICPRPGMSELERFAAAAKEAKLKPWPESSFNKFLEALTNSKKQNESKMEKAKEQIMLRYYQEAKKEQLARLKEWQNEINKFERVPLAVENDVDLEGPPRHMSYITEYKPSDGIVIPDDPIVGCECKSACDVRVEKTCCPSISGCALFPYNRYGKLRINVGVPVYECNKRCLCDPNLCTNRVVQKGRKTKLCIFRTDNGCGWGVKTLENIKADSFVVEYVGEVITSEEAERRGKQYDAEGRTYLFDLDFNGQDNPYTVDAAYYGNVAHFINHSCDPNLSIFNVWIDCLDPNLPRLCLFALRDIVKGEQLTFDYRQSTASENDLDSSLLSNGSPRKRMDAPDRDSEDNESEATKTECRCGTKNCRKWLFG